ncbi:MAG: hypothetical protein LLF76_09560 [Planctomycetaceae bacterium]|nr:hypothetical protein [Planctomycetaceae bacterium]
MGTLNIINSGEQVFSDRVQAGTMLAYQLERLKRYNPVVLGIPRGGVVIADQIAWQMGGSLDVVLARKIGAPSNAELAIGAVSENGELYLNDSLVEVLHIPEHYINHTRDSELAKIKRRQELYRQVIRRIPLESQMVILTDDGAATGATMQAAIWAARAEKPTWILVALPVGPPDTIKRLARHADEVVCLSAPSPFYAIGQFYQEFGQVSDEQVVDILSRHKEDHARQQ